MNAASVDYSRTNPSPRYRALVELYRGMHEHGEVARGRPAEKTYAGTNCLRQAPIIKGVLERFGASTLLDYGSGKGQQYLPEPLEQGGKTYPDLASYWGVDSVVCYDPGYAPYSKLPKGQFDGVISTDVLEHCPEEDIPWILEEIFSYARGFVYANVACYPASKKLSNGENAHCTVRPVEWWKARITETSARHPGVGFVFHFEVRDRPPPPRGLGERLQALMRKPRLVERVLVFES